MQENKLKQQSAESAKQNELAKQNQLANQHTANLLWEMDQEGEKEENTLFPSIISRFSSLFENGMLVGPRL